MIRVTFDDGTTEDREDDSPCIADVFDPVLRHPSEERWYLHFPGTARPFSFCGRTIHPLRALRGNQARIWRVAGQDDITKTLVGEWQSCHVETFEEQIARLTAARADEATRANIAEEVGRRERARADAAETALREVVRLGTRDKLGQQQAVVHAQEHIAGKPAPNIYERFAAAEQRAQDMAKAAIKGDKARGQTIWKLQNRLCRAKWTIRRLRKCIRAYKKVTSDLIWNGVTAGLIPDPLLNARGQRACATIRAGAEVRESLAGIADLKEDDAERPAAEERLARAQARYEAAQRAETAARGGGSD